MLHGRGARAANIVSLEEHLNLGRMSILAPQATNNSWYPYSFLAPVMSNQPALDSALQIVKELVDEVLHNDIDPSNLYFLGFSQGACLCLEYAARNARRYGGVISLTGGLIGQELNLENYRGDFEQTPFLITTGDPDPHVPLGRVDESIAVLERQNASITRKVYKGRTHTITMEEIELVNELILP